MILSIWLKHDPIFVYDQFKKCVNCKEFYKIHVYVRAYVWFHTTKGTGRILKTQHNMPDNLHGGYLDVIKPETQNKIINTLIANRVNKVQYLSVALLTLCVGNQRVTYGFFSQRANNAKSRSTLWRHYEYVTRYTEQFLCNSIRYTAPCSYIRNRYMWNGLWQM